MPSWSTVVLTSAVFRAARDDRVQGDAEACRPRTLPAAIVPVVVGTIAVRPYEVHESRALLALIVALALQIGTNYANDYSDGIRGTDQRRVGPVRLVGQGLASPNAVRWAAMASFLVAMVAGLIICSMTTYWLLPFGAAAVLAGWLYTGGPRPYGYLGLGEVFVFVFFGLLATAGSSYIELLSIPTVVWPAAVTVGLLATILLEANNLRDITGDTVSGKRTIAVRLGRVQAGYFVVVLCVGVAAGIALATLWRPWAAVAFLGLGPLVPLCRLALSDAQGPELLAMLPAAARAQLLVGALLAVGLANA